MNNVELDVIIMDGLTDQEHVYQRVTNYTGRVFSDFSDQQRSFRVLIGAKVTEWFYDVRLRNFQTSHNCTEEKIQYDLIANTVLSSGLIPVIAI